MSQTLLPHPVRALAVLGELEVEEARLFARKAQALVDYRTECEAQDPHGRGLRFLALDLAVECGIAQVTAATRLATAEQLVHELPGTHDLLLQGRLRVGQALVLLEETRGLDTELCRRLEQVALPQVLGLTAGETRRLVKQALVRLDARAGEDRRAQRHRERRAFVSPKPDGRAFVGVHGSAEAATGFWDALTLLATLTFGADDPRSLDQQRSDLALSLPDFALSSRRGHGPSLRSFLGLPDAEHGEGACALARRNDLTPAQQRRTQAVVLVPVQTGLGLADDPAELVGYGPVSAPHARELLAAAELRQACVDLSTGRLVALSDEVVRPPRWAGRYWPSAHPALHPVDLDGYEHGPGDDDPGGGPPGDGPPGDTPPGPARPDDGPPGDGPRVPRRRGRGAGTARQQENAPPLGSTAPRPPVTLHDALLGMVDTPLAAETRQEDRHDPSPGLADLIRFRDPRCIGPGCSTPSRRCDLEHWDPWPTGTTSADNLGPASRRCHNAKTFGGWSYTPHPDGSVTWTTPWGRTCVKRSSTRPVDLRDLRPRQVEPPPHQRPSDRAAR